MSAAVKVPIENFSPSARGHRPEHPLRMFKDFASEKAFPLIFASKHEAQGYPQLLLDAVTHGVLFLRSQLPGKGGCGGQRCRGGICLGRSGRAGRGAALGSGTSRGSVGLSLVREHRWDHGWEYGLGMRAGSIPAASPRARVPRGRRWECLCCVCIKSSYWHAVTAVLGCFQGVWL